MCQRATLQKLIQYATQIPSIPDSHDNAHKFPFVATDILTSSKTIAQALIEGGWSTKIDDGEESGEEKKSE